VISKSNTLVIIGEYYSDYSVVESEKYYFVGPTKIVGEVSDDTLLNDHARLNEIAEAQAAVYSDWVYGCNRLWLDSKLVFEKKLSLFFLSDFSCKRSEIFNTYNDIVNVLLLQEIVRENQFRRIRCVGVDEDLYFSIKSVFHDHTVEASHIRKIPEKRVRIWGGLIRYFFKAFVVSCFNLLQKMGEQQQITSSEQLYLTRYPMHFMKNRDKEEKYGGMFSQDDKYATSILTDGMHQSVSLRNYFRYRSEIKDNSHHLLLDDYIVPGDIVKAIGRVPFLFYRMFGIISESYCFSGIDITRQVRREINFSLNRIVRLLFWPQAVRRFIDHNRCRSFVYYLHEYPYGRLFTYILSQRSDIRAVGFQHGPSSPRKLLYYLSHHETGDSVDYLNSCPIPDEVYAEDHDSKELYESVGYVNVVVMKRIYRLDYLDKVTLSEDKEFVLVAAGLHDGEALLSILAERITSDKDQSYLFKPHPRAGDKYLNKYDLDNLRVTLRPIEELYSHASQVIVTYSSIGYEAMRLGIPVEVVHINGMVNQSPID